jgi:hypothetical protein
MKTNIIEAILIVIGLIMIVALLFGLPLQILWNLLMPELFSLPYISFWQACGLNLIAGILFRSNVTIKNKD